MNQCPSHRSYDRVNGVIFFVVRNSELKDFIKTVLQFENNFNRKFNYPYALFNDVPFSEEFKVEFKRVTNATVEFALIPKEHWSIPTFSDAEKIKSEFARQEREGYLYGGMESYHHMCRWNSGFFYYGQV